MIGPRPASEIADVLQHIAASDDRLLALFFIVHDLQPSGDADHRWIVRPSNPLALPAEGRNPFDDQIGRCDLVEQEIVAFACGAADRLGAAGAEPERRMRLLDWARLDDDIVEPPALALIGEPAWRRPRLADHLHGLIKPLGRLLGRNAEAREFIAAVAL